MHAASVHPEPGSNSLKNCILYAKAHKNFFRAKILSFFLLFEFYSMCFLTRFLYTPFVFTKVCFEILLFNFQGSMPAKIISARQPDYYSTPFSLCQYLFSNFFKFFWGFFLFVQIVKKARRGILRAVHYYTLSRAISTISFQTSSPGLPIRRGIPSSMISLPVRTTPSRTL